MSAEFPHQLVGTYHDIDYYLAEEDIFLVVPRSGFRDTAESARQNVEYLNDYIRKAGRKFGAVIILKHVLSQDAETRRTYQSLTENGLYFGLALVVDSAMSRAVAGFFMGFSKPAVPTQLFDTAENGIEWLKTIRPN